MTSLDIEQRILGRLRTLPPSAKKRALAFVESLGQASNRPQTTARGLWADLELTVDDSDIDAARAEMWGSFPRDIRT
jgi:hypothetical protein